ncbi:MAG: penicillin-binding protein 2 [Candidatus Omnitrophota bacterium]|nr:penicillin-binding protein 2 [Candidatus Omnitrophota bacterium]
MGERLLRLQLMLLVAFGVLVVRLVHLQLVHGHMYRRLAEQNRVRLVHEPSPRGLILDSQGRVMAASQTIFRVAVVPQETPDLASLLAHISPLTHRSPEVLRAQYQKERSFAFVPATIVSYVPKETALQLEEARWRLPGLLVKSETVRAYPGGSVAAHVLGYLSQPTAEELPRLKSYGVRPTQLVGRMGVERLLDDVLRGTSGGLMVEVNNRGKQVRVLGRKPPEGGGLVILTLDVALQSLIAQALGSQAGAAVVLNPTTGAVLAMVSSPSFSPESFVITSGDTVRRLLIDPQAPLMNRSTVGMYTPGSIAKLITAAAALDQHVITPSTTIVCPGALTIGDRTFHCWNRDGHGPLTLSEALMQSCNVYFMTVGRRLGVARLRAAMERIGWGRRSGWPMEEQPGHLPSRRLTEGEVAILAIGQGEVLLTPTQAAVMASAFANGGSVVTPWIVQSVEGRPGPRPVSRRIGWSAATLEAVREGMQMVVSHPAGTGHRAFTSTVSIAGKTGTAQTHEPERPHGWFVGFCPVEQPRVAMAIVAEHGGSGGDLPADIARSICEYVSAAEIL